MGLTSSRLGRLSLVPLLALLLAAGPFLLSPRAALAAAFVVNQTTDEPDLDLTDAVCDVSTTNGNQCTLRAAIQESNDTLGPDTINFNIPGPPNQVKSIKPDNPLPALIQRVTIDGYTQPGSSVNTLPAGSLGTNAVLRIELDGINASGNDALVVRGPNSLIRGLAIGRWGTSGDAIEVEETADGTRILGNFLGTNAAGTQPRVNEDGVDIDDAENVSVGNGAPAARNLISGNDSDGVELDSAANRARILNNSIGVTKAGTGPLPNLGDGIDSEADDTFFGGNSAVEANVIQFNDNNGVNVDSNATRNRILRNNIGANGDLGIDLNNDGRTLNDAGDADTGGNTRQNFPVITVATTNLVQITLNSKPNQNFFVRIYSNPGNGAQGVRFHGGPFTVTTDGAGDTGPENLVPNPPIPAGRSVTVTATNADGSTSEFSDPEPVA